jgi:hypothetical protein
MIGWLKHVIHIFRANRSARIGSKGAPAADSVKRWHTVEEDLPPPDQWVLGYCEIFGLYYICKFAPSRGWVSVSRETLVAVSHWCEDALFMPFEIRNELDSYYAQKHGFKVQ